MADRPARPVRLALDRLPLRAQNGVYNAVIEAAAGSRNKCKFEPALGVMVLHKVLPLGLSYPYSFGFIPRTEGDDGDPLDVLVLMDEPVPPGVVVPCRLLGVIEAWQREGRRRMRNDRLIAVAQRGERYRACRALRDLRRGVLDQIEQFFVTHNAEESKVFAPIGRYGRARAEALIERGARRYGDGQAGASGPP